MRARLGERDGADVDGADVDGAERAVVRLCEDEREALVDLAPDAAHALLAAAERDERDAADDGVRFSECEELPALDRARAARALPATSPSACAASEGHERVHGARPPATRPAVGVGPRCGVARDRR